VQNALPAPAPAASLPAPAPDDGTSMYVDGLGWYSPARSAGLGVYV
jgi:hypothetical protein